MTEVVREIIGQALADAIIARAVDAINASRPDCRWIPESEGMEVCDEHSELVIGPDGCEDSPRWWKQIAINAIRAECAARP